MAISEIVKAVTEVAKALNENNKTTTKANKPSYIQTYSPTASKYDSEIAGLQGAINSYDDAIANAGASYQNIANVYSNSANSQNAALQQAMGANKDQINSLYDNSARDYYRLYKTQQKALPENLSRAGVTGGASESSQLKLLNSYSDNLYRNESARDNALAGNMADYQEKMAQNSIAAANQLAGYYNSYQNQIAGYAQDKAQAQAELNSVIAAQQAAAAVDKWNTNVTNRINEQLNRTGGDTLWTYTTSDGKLHWTTDRNNAKALSSQYKMNEITSVPSKTTTKKSTSKSSKKAGSGGGSPANDNANAATSSDLANYARQATGIMYGNSSYATRTDGATDTLNYIEGLVKGKEISTNQAATLIEKLGLS